MGWFIAGAFVFGFWIGFIIASCMNSAAVSGLLKENEALMDAVGELSKGKRIVLLNKQIFGGANGQREKQQTG